MNGTSSQRSISRLILIAALLGAVSGAFAVDIRFDPGEWMRGTFAMTTYGAVEGEKDKDETIAWRGIPYAAPPVGALRWRAPREPESWKGIRHAGKFGPRAAQKGTVLGWPTGSEDCLYLNIWRPDSAEKELPVYVWIHGGGNSTGSSDAVSDYRGHALASTADAVFVSINYRLGVLGWFSHPALRIGEPETDSGNFGTLDIIAALTWIAGNIRAFGGDPHNVTIAGESAGAFNVLTLLLAPGARGLFHRAVVQSGYRTDSTPESVAAFTQRFTAKLAQETGKAKNPGGAAKFLADLSQASAAAWLKSASTGQLLSTLDSGSAGMIDFPYPIWDGHVLPAEGFAAFSDPAKVAPVPVIIGSNREETKIFQWLSRQDSREPLYQAGAEVSSAAWKARGVDSIADALASRDNSRSVWVYRFDWGAPDSKGRSVLGASTGRKMGAFHSLEIPFFLQSETVLGNVLPFKIFTGRNEPGRKALQRTMGSYLVNYLRKGTPNGAGLPEWPRWNETLADPGFIIFDASEDGAFVRADRGRTTIESIRSRIETSYPEDLKPALRALLEK